MALVRRVQAKTRDLGAWAARTFLRPASRTILDRQPLPPRETPVL